ncbi:MAG TPA: hypothetical protein PK959_00125, partial [Candidatus Competibacteraceae bacterium]|nr:hypothetical protein [Candidatus Competibacteraceae bacterium]
VFHLLGDFPVSGNRFKAGGNIDLFTSDVNNILKNILFFRYFVGAIDAAKSDAPVFYPAFAGVFYALVGHVNLQGEVSQ